MAEPAGDAIRILLVEDNPLDARATIRAAEKLKIANDIEHVTDGDAALAFLRTATPKPDLVLLDLNLPGKDGHDVLAEMQKEHELRRIPVVVLTSSADDNDILNSYDLGANAFVTKPVDLDGWREVVGKIEGFWFSLVRLPPR